ncbi:MAG: response regulator [Clostridia bacterium]|nr:response regulator [Clostridia bacterium]
MIAIAVDDEALMLGALVAAVEASPDVADVIGFSDCEAALEYVKSTPIDVAFLDINMRGMGGLALAEKIIAARPYCKIVFCTGYEEYAIPAFKLHASGYLMKPVSAEDVQVEIDNINFILHIFNRNRF